MSSHVQSRGLRRICFFISVAHGVLAPFLEIIAQNNPYRVRRLPRVLTTRYLEYNLIHNRDVAKPLSACYDLRFKAPYHNRGIRDTGGLETLTKLVI